jgi:hypothetical protein
MEETLLAFALAILVVAVAVFLRLRRSIKEASEETTALQKRVATFEQRIRELEWAQAQAKESARNLRVREVAPVRPMMRPATAPPIPPVTFPFTESQKEVAEALNQLLVMKAQLSLDPIVKEEYITELNGIVDRLERATVCDLGRWLGLPPQDLQPGAASDNQKTDVSKARIQSRDRDLFRLQITALQAFCDYQTHHPQLPKGFVPAPREAARVIH